MGNKDWLHVGDLEDWNEGTEWAWNEPKEYLVLGWGWAVVHPFNNSSPGSGIEEYGKVTYGIVFAVYCDPEHAQRKALFILDGGHMGENTTSPHKGWTYDYWQA